MLHTDLEIFPHGAWVDAGEADVNLIVKPDALMNPQGFFHGWNRDGVVVMPSDPLPAGERKNRRRETRELFNILSGLLLSARLV